MKVKRIVLLHGWGANTKKLGPLKIALEKLGWKVLLPKLPGFEKPAPKKVWGMKEYAKFIYEETKLVFGKNKFFVFGHSFGGGIAIKLASGNPRQLAGVILCASRGISRTKAVKRLFFKTLAKIGKIFLFSPYIANEFRKILYKAAREHDYERSEGIMREVFRKVISEDLRTLVFKIKLPVLILWGENDRMTPISDALFIKHALHESVLVTFKDKGHRLPYEEPFSLAEEIDKWAQSLQY